MNYSAVSGSDWETPFKGTLVIQAKTLQHNALTWEKFQEGKFWSKGN